jgi:hypothetical protein
VTHKSSIQPIVTLVFRLVDEIKISAQQPIPMDGQAHRSDFFQENDLVGFLL